ncbi:MAG TPA: serine protease [Xanthobacteraceae bacterium]|jgi:peptidoglycan hydrolase-like protein with peptidoglycan-binding domain
MRIAGAALIFAMTLGPGFGQTQNAPPAHRVIHPAAAAKNPPAAAETKPATGDAKVDPKKKAAPAGRDATSGLSPAERALIQFDLAWAGAYNGLITGEANDKTVAAIKAFQKDRGLKETGTLAPPERAQLGALSKEKQDQVGWRMVDDKVTGVQIGLPTKQVPNTGAGKSGTRWFSAQGQIQVETFRIRGPGTTLADVYDQQKKEPQGRHLEVNLLRPDFFILSGIQGLKKFYVRAEIRDAEVRGMTLLYDQATEGTMDPVAVVMSSAFAPFSGSGIPALAGLPGKRKVEYGSGIIVTAAGDILTDRRLTDGCNVIGVAGYGNAEEVAQDAAANLALLRIYGASDLTPAALVQNGGKGPDLTLVGISDPQAQGGGNAVSTVAARLNGDTILPAPPPGFDGAAALDAQGRLLGMVQLKDAVVANAGAAAAAASATLASADTLRKFLAAQSVAPASGGTRTGTAKAAVVRVICVRK